MRTLQDAEKALREALDAGTPIDSAVARLVVEMSVPAHKQASRALLTERAEQYVRERVVNRERVASGMLPKGRLTPEEREAREALRDQRSADRWSALWPKLQSALADYTESMRIEWTAELRHSTIKLGDGTETTWGEASIEQHQQRIDMLTAQATGTLEAAARHQRAIADIRSVGARSLNDACELVPS